MQKKPSDSTRRMARGAIAMLILQFALNATLIWAKVEVPLTINVLDPCESNLTSNTNATVLDCTNNPSNEPKSRDSNTQKTGDKRAKTASGPNPDKDSSQGTKPYVLSGALLLTTIIAAVLVWKR